MSSEGNRGLETRGTSSPSPNFGEYSGWGESFENSLGIFGVGTAKIFRGQVVPVPENPRISGTGTRTTNSGNFPTLMSINSWFKIRDEVELNLFPNIKQTVGIFTGKLTN